jgi:hypothetical protein
MVILRSPERIRQNGEVAGRGGVEIRGEGDGYFAFIILIKVRYSNHSKKYFCI